MDDRFGGAPNQVGSGGGNPFTGVGTGAFAGQNPGTGVTTGVFGAVSGGGMATGVASVGAPTGVGTPVTGVEATGLNRPMTKAAQPAPVVQKKPKKGLIIGICCGAATALLLIILGVAVAITMNQPNLVADAMEKLMTNGLPQNVHAVLTASANMTDKTQLITRYGVNLATDVMTGDMTNTTDITVTLGRDSMENLTFMVNEVYAGEKDQYVRFDGIAKAMDGMDTAEYYLNGGDKEEKELICEDEDGEEIVCPDEETEEGTGSSSTSKKSSSSGAKSGSSRTKSNDSSAKSDDSDDSDEKTDDSADSKSSNAKNSSNSKTTNSLKIKNPFGEEMMQEMLDLSEVIDGKWVQIPPEGKVESVTSEENEEGETEEVTETILDVADYTAYLTQIIEDIGGRETVCGTDLLAKLKQNSSAVSRYYISHPFISGTKEGVTLAGKGYTPYRVVIDPENHEAFVDELQNQGLLSDYLKCAGATVADVKNYALTMPPIIVEIDSAGDFSRIYIATNTGTADVTLDLSLSYPATINVQKPQKFITLQEVADGMAELVL